MRNFVEHLTFSLCRGFSLFAIYLIADFITKARYPTLLVLIVLHTVSVSFYFPDLSANFNYLQQKTRESPLVNKAIISKIYSQSFLKLGHNVYNAYSSSLFQ